MKKSLRWLLFLVISGALTIGLTLTAERGVLLDHSGVTSVWRLVSRKWERTPSLPGAAMEIKVTDNGSVWVTTAFHAGLSRWDGDHWTWFKGSDFGTQTNYVSGSFALAG